MRQSLIEQRKELVRSEAIEKDLELAGTETGLGEGFQVREPGPACSPTDADW